MPPMLLWSLRNQKLRRNSLWMLKRSSVAVPLLTPWPRSGREVERCAPLGSPNTVSTAVGAKESTRREGRKESWSSRARSRQRGRRERILEARLVDLTIGCALRVEPLAPRAIRWCLASHKRPVVTCCRLRRVSCASPRCCAVLTENGHNHLQRRGVGFIRASKVSYVARSGQTASTASVASTNAPTTARARPVRLSRHACRADGVDKTPSGRMCSATLALSARAWWSRQDPANTFRSKCVIAGSQVQRMVHSVGYRCRFTRPFPH